LFVGQEEGKEWLLSGGWCLSYWRADFKERAADESEFVYHVTKFRQEFGERKVWLGLSGEGAIGEQGLVAGKAVSGTTRVSGFEMGT
jgi:hypothetical protein